MIECDEDGMSECWAISVGAVMDMAEGEAVVDEAIGMVAVVVEVIEVGKIGEVIARSVVDELAVVVRALGGGKIGGLRM